MGFYKDKRVFLTGHTGFKGSWLTRILIMAGAEVTGYSLEPPLSDNLFALADVRDSITHVVGDICDYDMLKRAYDEANPEIVFHLAAQPIVLDGYKEPKLTYETNIMGTVNLLECVRQNKSTKSFLNVTTDKVYQNNEWVWGYRENEPLNGFDPYSNSKSCSELVTSSYRNSFFPDGSTAISTARAGNVIGGGDFANERIIPDCVRAVCEQRDIRVRNPLSIRPYQHVLEPLFVYLMIAERQYNDNKYAGEYNVGPNEADCVNTRTLVDMFCSEWGNGQTWNCISGDNAVHEANFLKLDCSKLKAIFGWEPKWSISKAIQQTVAWTKVWLENGNIPTEMDREIRMYMEEN